MLLKLCASFCSHLWIRTGVTVRKLRIWVKIGHFLSRATLIFDRWPWKTIGHLSYSTSSFVHHFVAIGEFELELQSRNAKFGSKSVIFVPCDLEIWRMTLKNNRAFFLCYASSGSVHHFVALSYGPQKHTPNLGKICFDLCDLNLWHLTLTFCMDIKFV